MRLVNLGCGDNRLEGWENYDSELDITKPLPWPDNSVDFILAEHVVEHVSGPDAFRFMMECRRVLVPGGTLRVCVPVLRRLEVEKARDIILNHGHLCTYHDELLQELLIVAGYFGVRVSERKACDGHWKIIGKEQDDAETCRVEGVKRPLEKPA